ncbi:MAG: hypothetical protein ACLP9L_28955 [Thermoguttaceae bacterium]
MVLKNRPLESRTPRLWTAPVTITALVLVAVVAAVSLVPRAMAEEKPAISQATKPADEVSPTRDQSATKEESKTESKPAPTHGLTAEPNTDQAKAIGEWHMLGNTELASIKVEKVLYEAAGNPHFFIHVRVTNVTDRAVGVDLKGNVQWTAVYPKMAVKLDTDGRGKIRESRIQHEPLDEHARATLRADFAAGKLTTIPAGKSADYYRELINNNRAYVDKLRGKYLIISLDGEQLLTDGAKVEQFNLEWRHGSGDHARTDLVIPSPVPWNTIPAHGRIVPQG